MAVRSRRLTLLSCCVVFAVSTAVVATATGQARGTTTIARAYAVHLSHGFATGAGSACTSPPHPGLVAGATVVDKLNRTYLFYVPRHLAAGHHYPLVLVFHGSDSNAAYMAQYFHIGPLAEHYHSIVAFANGWDSSRSWRSGLNGTSWVDFPGSPNQPDVDYVRHLIAIASARFCINPRRIYAAGFSIGGSIVHRLACDLSDRIVAVALVAGSQMVNSYVDDCHPKHAVSLIAFHGTRDLTIPYADIPIWARHWARRDGCKQGPSPFFHHKKVTAIRYARCRSGTQVELYTISGGGHEWPHDRIQTVDANQVMWAFFAAHPRQ